MSYKLRYRIEFTGDNQQDWRCDILERDYGGSSTTIKGSGEPLFINLKEQNQPKYEIVKAKQVELGVYSIDNFDYESLFTSDDRKYKANVYKGNDLDFSGYLIADLYSEPYTAPPYPVKLSVTDGLAGLTDAHDFDGLVTGHDVIFSLLDDLSLDLPLYDSSHIYPDGADLDNSALFQVQFSHTRWGGLTDFEVLKAVLATQASMIMQDSGAWHIVPFELRGKEHTRTLYNSSGVRQGQALFDPVVPAVNKPTSAWLNKDQVMDILSARKNIQVDNDIGAIGNLVTSGDFNRDDIEFSGGSPTVPTGWTDNGLNIGISTVGLEDSPEAIIIDPSGGGTSSQISEGSANIDVSDKELQPSAGDKLLISIRYRFRFTASGTPNFVVRVGDNWLRRVGDNYEWTGSFSTLSWRTYESQEFQELIIETPEIPSGGNVRFAIYNFGVAAGQSGSFEVAQWVVNYLPEGITSAERFTTSISRDINADATPVSYTLLHGDAPATISPGALFFGGSLTTNWNRRDETDNAPLRNIITQTLAKLYQSPARRITGSLRGNHSWVNAISDQSKTLVPVGGSYNVKMATYNAEWVEFFTTEVGGIDVTEIVEREQSTFRGRGIGEVELVDEIGLRLLGIGFITQDLDGTYTDIPVQLNSPARVGFDYIIYDEATKERFGFTVTNGGQSVEEWGPGQLNLPIQDEQIVALEGSHIFLVAGQSNIEEQIFKERIASLDASLENLNDNVLPELDDRLGTLDGFFQDPSTIPAGYSFFQGIVTADIWAIDGTFFNVWADNVFGNTGMFNRVTANIIDVDDLGANSAFIIKLMAQDLVLRESGFIRSTNYTQGSLGFRIAANGDVEFNSGTFRGTIVVTGGNAATDDDLDTLSGQLNVTIRSATAPTQRNNGDALVAGDAWLKTNEGDLPHSWNGSAWTRSYTIIDGGNLITGSVDAEKIDVDDLFATNVTITGTLTMGAGAISNVGGGFAISSDGFRVNGGANINEDESYSLYNSAKTNPVGSLSSYTSSPPFSSDGTVSLRTAEDFALSLVGNKGVLISVPVGGGQIQITSSDGEYAILSLPTTAPGTANRLFTRTWSQLNAGSASEKILCIS